MVMVHVGESHPARSLQHLETGLSRSPEGRIPAAAYLR